MRGKCHRRPGKAPRCCARVSDFFKPVEAALNSRVRCFAGEGKQGNRRGVGMWGERLSVDNAVAGIPPASGTHTVEQHFDSAIDPKASVRLLVRREVLPQSKQRERT